MGETRNRISEEWPLDFRLLVIAPEPVRGMAQASDEHPMKNPRTYGKAPFGVVLIHGDPGAAGEIAPIAHLQAA